MVAQGADLDPLAVVVAVAVKDPLTAALRYAARAWFVFPVRSRAKVPLTAHGAKDASTDPDIIRSWWSRWPDANIGIACGPSELAVVDVDDPQGFASLSRLQESGFTLPPTVTQATGGGGVHFFFKAPTWPLRNTAGRLPGFESTPGVDLRAVGGFVVVPPSVHPSGGRYTWRPGPDAPTPCPAWLREPERPRPGPPARAPVVPDRYAQAALRGEVEEVRNAPIGERNMTLNIASFRLGTLCGAGFLDWREAGSWLLRAALDAGLTDHEARATIQSGLNAGISTPREVSR